MSCDCENSEQDLVETVIQELNHEYIFVWTGDCEKGKASGHGVLSWFAEGEFVDGVLQGWGSWKVPS